MLDQNTAISGELQVRALCSNCSLPEQRKAGEFLHAPSTLLKSSKAMVARIALIPAGSLGFIDLCSRFKASLTNA